jgi:hypothetical protein
MIAQRETIFMHDRWDNKIITIFTVIPIFSLISCAINWLRFGIDLPFGDDWRAYHSGKIGSFNLSYLFTSTNDTLYPVGKILDSIAYRFLDGNAVAYQFISMICVLGLLLLLQWRLLLLALNNRLLAASAFSLTLLMLQPDTYWGRQCLAYHQAIPLVGILASIYVVLRGNWNGRLAVPLLFMLGLIAGFSYISGAFAILAISVCFLVLQKFIAASERKPLFAGGMALFVVGIVTTLAQAWVILVTQKGIHKRDTGMAFPTESNFWFYMLGKVARSLMLPLEHPFVALMVTGAIVIFTLTLIFWALRLLIKNKSQSFNDARPMLIFVSIFGVIFTYLMLISAGRTNFYSTASNTSIELFSIGFYRFHFFWVTLLWPWVAAISFILLGKCATSRHGLLERKAALFMPIATVPLMVYAGAMDYPDYFNKEMYRQAEGIKCLITEMQKGEEINCPHIWRRDLRSAIINANNSGASFTRVLPITNDDSRPIFRLTKNWQNVELHNMVHDLSSEEGKKLNAGNDPAIVFKTGASKKMANCKKLDVSVRIRVTQADVAQLFYKAREQKIFTEAASLTEPIDVDTKFKSVSFTVRSQSGFEDDLRFDPVMKPQHFELKELLVSCS